jgi:hypothetical protein
MPAPIPDLSRDQQCHHYQAPTGQRCGSPALKGEYYCYFHHIKNRKTRILIDPELTSMELPVIEDRATIFVALTAVIHRLAANTIDTRRAGQMIYALQTALQALPPPEPQRKTPPTPQPTAPPPSNPPPTPPAVEICNSDPERSEGEESPHLAPATAPKQITITKESLVYFLRSRHCYNCNAELFPAHELTERSNPGATPTPIEENDFIKRLGEYHASLPHRASTVVPSSAERSASNAAGTQFHLRN